ncbi:MAG: lipase, partial [Clostridia bacterium]|nr:lipase [Clostridia bacterium]
DTNSLVPLTFGGQNSVTICSGEEIISDEIDFDVKSDCNYFISYYLKDFTNMTNGVLIKGPLVHNYYAFGDYIDEEEFPYEKRMNTSYYHFINTVDVKTQDDANALVIFGDSITAQGYPDYITLGLKENGIDNRSIIRRGVCGTRVLGQYNTVLYASYGLCGETRFEPETQVDGCDKIVVLHGINDLIHPDGKNPLRPMSNMPTCEQMVEGYRFYIKKAKKAGKKIYFATLLPIKDWRTYDEMRNGIRHEINEWIRTTDEIDGFIDLDKAIRDPNDIDRMLPIYDSGDHLHPSDEGTKRMAEEFLKFLK